MRATKTPRNLDVVYFRVEREGRWQNVCYSDMTAAERDCIAKERAANSTPEEQVQWWRSIANHMADQLYDMGEQFGISGVDA